MGNEFIIRFYRLKDSVICDRAGTITSGEDVLHASTLEKAGEVSRDFVASHPTLGCMVYRPDGGFALQVRGSLPAGKPKQTRQRSFLLAGVQLIPAAALVWWDAANNFGLILPTLLASRLIYGGLFKAVDGVLGPDREHNKD